MRYIVELIRHSGLFRTPDSPSAVHLPHLQLLLFLGIVTTSGFHGDAKVSRLTVGAHLRQLEKRVAGSLLVSNLTTILMNTKKYSSWGEAAGFSSAELLEKLAGTDFVGDITRQQPAPTRVMSRVLMPQLVWLPEV